ncbi:MAG: hypothetical protein V2A58_14260 [Planctomycetota bacterium]
MTPPRPITHPPRFHFFGYYGMTPWNATGKYLLAIETSFMDRPPAADDQATVGMVELDTGKFIRLAETRAWNWQQGCMMHWLPTAPDRLIIYNDRRDGRFVSVILDIESGAERVIDRAVAAISRSGRYALSINFARLAVTRPGYGYEGILDPFQRENRPPGDGIYLVDLERNTSKLVIPLAQLAPLIPAPPQDKLWFNHLLFNTDDSRFCFLGRFRPKEGRFSSSLSTSFFTSDPSGARLHCLARDTVVSHFDWKSEKEILAFAQYRDVGYRFILYTDLTDTQRPVGQGKLTTDGSAQDQDGHCSWSPDRTWILNDTYPLDDGCRRLMLYNPEKDLLIPLGKYLSPPETNKPEEIRCDLHPRWSRDGSQVCFDSLHEGTRQIYLLDVAQYTR